MNMAEINLASEKLYMSECWVQKQSIHPPKARVLLLFQTTQGRVKGGPENTRTTAMSNLKHWWSSQWASQPC